MRLNVVVHMELELKSPAEKFWLALGDAINLFPKASPEDYKNIQSIAGDGISPGSIILITYGEGSPLVKISAERIESVDLEKKTLTYSVIGGDIMQYYKTFKATVSVIAKDSGSLVKWSCEFEKIGHEVADPHKDIVVKNFKNVDEYILKQSSV